MAIADEIRPEGTPLPPSAAQAFEGLQVVGVRPLDIERYAACLRPAQMEELRETSARARDMFAGRVVWQVNSTAKGGGVAEMLNAFLPYVRGAGVDTRWAVIEGDPEFFRITKRIHNHLHGDDGDSPLLTDSDRAHYDAVLGARAETLAELLDADDYVVLHDPQTLGLAPLLAQRCAGVVWRCHIGVDHPNQRVRETWDFLRSYLLVSDAVIFSRRQFVWDGLDGCRVEIIPPSIDPFSAKNRAIEPAHADSILSAIGVLALPVAPPQPVEFERQDDSRGVIVHSAEVVETQRLTPRDRIVLQVSRWDRLKDPVGVLEGFRRRIAGRAEAHLVLAGPSIRDVADDPEGREVLAEVRGACEAMSGSERALVHLVSLPMDDEEENAAMVNALQQRAEVVVQKSLAEGFGLTVSEAMWKARPVVASAVGGIQDQIVDGVSGVLIGDPRDLDTFGDAVLGLLRDAERSAAIGSAARERVRECFLGTRSLLQYAELLLSLRR